MLLHKRRGRAATAIAIAILVSGLVPNAAPAAEPVSAASAKLSVNGKSFTVHTVKVDVKDPSLEVVPVVAAGGIGHDEAFASIIGREQAVAAVNGTFFNAYEKNSAIRYPNGALLAEGELLHSGENQTFVIGPDKTPAIRWASLGAAVQVGQGEAAYTVRPWGVNKYYGADNVDQTVLFTDEFGGWIGFSGGMKIVIEEGKITRITEDAVAVPAGGSVLFLGLSANNRTHVLPHLHVGDPVVVQPFATGEAGADQPAAWLAALGAGPKLVTAGEPDIDFARDGFTDPGITQRAAARSFAGVDQDGQLVLGAVSSATIAELAQIAVRLGLREAMNLDGGASSGLYANGAMLQAPGRSLSNALVVRRTAAPKVQIELNGQLLTDFKGRLAGVTTMVPIRPFITALQAEFQWDAEAREATISYDGATLKLRDGQSEAVVNGKRVGLTMPLTILEDSRMYVPLRFVSESLNGRVEWDASLYRAIIDL
ncbi:Copper amine oxidase N-terminal domain-containing protein [Paenibacillus sp. UNCCL117]|uniref:phosphodiester glycosidase family protein n=1 Tax=unclassified Paenibacillus TaxID=185978 RepID=UPI000884131D|nr:MULTISPECIES: phosphodiester glycosidase family protein [unclassified Paenibacillus]SDC89986.1 Copper amine oxidase N-terminal domain-containing protein [Paenibacillus sp. cl123]SFW28709.1 Copper amine oxidase N-terminal domain-containing protein [Paenibacillus sp. UNCCL117]